MTMLPPVGEKNVKTPSPRLSLEMARFYCLPTMGQVEKEKRRYRNYRNASSFFMNNYRTC